MKEKLFQWMKSKTSLSEISIKKYISGVFVVSKEMEEAGVISKPLEDMNIFELDIAIGVIMKNPQFITKNTVGRRMYSNSLKQFRYYMVEMAEIPELEIQVETENETEKVSLVKSRVGQGQYRQDLMDKYQGQCVITGINLPKLLIASHIKPWAVSSNEERLDVENGFLLSSNLDKLFDSGLMSFKKDGKMMLSSFVGKENEEKLHISKDMVVDLKATAQLLQYLEYHRDVLFVK